MKAKKLIIWWLISSVVASVSLFVYRKAFREEKKLPYITTWPERRTIKRIIDTTGRIHVAEKVKIGSLVTGVLEKLYADENDWVKKGQLLATIDTGISNYDVRKAKGTLRKVLATRNYLSDFLARQTALYKSGQLSQDNYDQVVRDYETSLGDYEFAKANLDIAQEAFDNTKIIAPQDGVILNVGISEGERVTTDLDATVLFEIAQDITKMEAKLEIDESNVGYVKVGQIVEFTVDSFPNRIFTTKIKEISYAAKVKAGNYYYKATIEIDNSEKILRPGLTVNAKIFVAQADDVLAITSQAFMISNKVMAEIAKDLDYSFHPVKEEEVEKIRKETGLATQTAWVVQKNGTPYSFVEMIVTTNVTDDIYFEITSGLSPDDEVIIELEESDYMEEMLRKAFKSGF